MRESQALAKWNTNPWVAQAMIHFQGHPLFGSWPGRDADRRSPLDPEALWDKMYTGSLMTGRRGLGICAMGAIDMALWDIRGKAFGQPCWRFLGGARKTHITPYASLLLTGRNPAEYRDSLAAKAGEARRLGFRAVKLEVVLKGPYAHNGITGSNEQSSKSSQRVVKRWARTW